ncbi:aromatic ring-hydroxylating dioxygenase subunit alpha [soil metagenome]
MSYVRNAWYVASWSSEVGSQKPVGMRILGEPIVLWRNEAGELAALEDRCVHRLAPLSLGRCEGANLRCMYHGLLFDRAGAVQEISGQDLIPAHARVRSYPVAERHSWIWVWMGGAMQADEALIPPAVGLDHPDYLLGHGQIDYAAEARLINDNLLDFSHLSYVHANSFGSSDAWSRNRPTLTPLERGVRFERWIVGEVGVPGKNLSEAVDRFSSYDFLVPGILLMSGGAFPEGTAAALGHKRPDLANAIDGVTFTSQAVTPLTDKTSRYFFSWGPHRDHGDEALRDTLMEIAGRAFEEDRVMIEAQQRVIDATPDPRIMPTSADRGVTIFNRLAEKLARGEIAAAA